MKKYKLANTSSDAPLLKFSHPIYDNCLPQIDTFLLNVIENSIYPLASNSTGHDEVFVGRIKKDLSVKNSLNLLVVSDNLRKGAATNAIQIMEKLIEMEAN